jgi:hypothetical protein
MRASYQPAPGRNQRIVANSESTSIFVAGHAARDDEEGRVRPVALEDAQDLGSGGRIGAVVDRERDGLCSRLDAIEDLGMVPGEMADLPLDRGTAGEAVGGRGEHRERCEPPPASPHGRSVAPLRI